MIRILTAFIAFLFLAVPARAETIRLLMETVPDTRYIEELLPEFEKQTGIKVEMEVISRFNVRGGVDHEITASYQREDEEGPI